MEDRVTRFVIVSGLLSTGATFLNKTDRALLALALIGNQGHLASGDGESDNNLGGCDAASGKDSDRVKMRNDIAITTRREASDLGA